MLLGGLVTDKLVSVVGVRWARRLPWIISKIIAVMAFAISPGLDSPWLVTAMMATVAFCVDFGNPATWAFTQDVGGKHVGSVARFWKHVGQPGRSSITDPANLDLCQLQLEPHVLYLCSPVYGFNHLLLLYRCGNPSHP